MSDDSLYDSDEKEADPTRESGRIAPNRQQTGQQSGMVTGLPTWAVEPGDHESTESPGGRAPDATVLQSNRTRTAPPPATEGRRRGGDPRWLTIALAVVAGLALLALAFQLGLSAGSDTNEASGQGEEQAGDAGQGDSDADADGAGSSDDAGSQTTTGGTVVVAAPSTEAGGEEETPAPTGAPGSAVRLTLDNYQFTVDGVVPSEEIKAGIEQRMGLVFAEFGTSNLTVDPAVEPASWLEGAPSLINTMVLLHNGTIDISPDGVDISGRALATDFDKLGATFTSERGFPPLTFSDQDVIDKPAPWVRAIASGDGTVTMTGELADETMRSTIIEGAQAVYGAANVIDQTTVNPERHNRFLIMRFPSNLAAYQAFGEFDIRGENESFTAILENGLVFGILETELTPDSRERLAGVMFTLTRNPLPVTVVGHTDSVGAQADNQALSEARAESVAAFLVENGVLPENLQTFARGESEPIGDNSTAEGRARNRRVEITVGLYNE